MVCNMNDTTCHQGNVNDVVTGYNTSLQNEPFDYYEYMHYDYEADPDNVPIQELIPVSIVYGLTLIFGLVGNTLVIVSVAKFKKMQNVTNMFLLSLASADLLLVVICVPVKCVAFFSYIWKFGVVLCKMVHYVQNVSIVCSVMNLTVLSLERYYAIMHPIRAKCVSTVALAKKTILVLWILSLIMASPILIGRIHKPVGSGNTTGYWCTTEWDRPLYEQLYGTYMFLIILAIPLSLMTFAYTSICRRVWTLHKKRPQAIQHRSRYRDQLETTQFIEPKPAVLHELSISSHGFLKELSVKNVPIPNDYNTRKQVIKMLVAIVLLFMICWGPITTNNLLVAFGILDNLHQGFLRPLRIAFFLMSYFNSCTNPIVYAFMSRNFRNTFKHTLFLLCRRIIVSRQNHHMAKACGDNRSYSLNSNKTTNVLFDVTDAKSHVANQEKTFGTLSFDMNNGCNKS